MAVAAGIERLVTVKRVFGVIRRAHEWKSSLVKVIKYPLTAFV
jgi:hypothetical protein